MIIHELVQGSPEWDAFRLNHHGASEAAAMLGLSKKVMRSDLLKIKHTGIAKEFSAWVQKNVLDHGHEVEALARPLVEEIIGDDLYPVTCSNEDEGGHLSASCDGLTLVGDTAFEHKQWNAELAAAVASGVLPDEYMPQCQQIMLVTGAQRVVFVVSDGTPDNLVHLEVTPDHEWFDRIRAGWEQFDRDLAEYVLTETPVEVVGRAPDALPALRIEVSGAVTASNLAEFKQHALEVIGNVKTDLHTDEDFADADKTTKWCKEVEDRLDAAKQHALSQTSSIDELFRTIDAIKEEARQKRLTLEKLVKQRKESIRIEKVDASQRLFQVHIAALQAEIVGVRLAVAQPDFGGAIKGLKTLTSIQNSLDTTLANAKIEADAVAKDVREKLSWCKENASGKSALFPDLQQLIAKPMEDFTLTIRSRINQAEQAEAARLERERERIRQEEAAKVAVLSTVAVSQVASQQATHDSRTVAQPTASPSNTPTGAPTLKLGQINERLAPISLTADGLASLGFVHAATDKSAKLYHEQDFQRICDALVRHIQIAKGARPLAASVAAQPRSEAPTLEMIAERICASRTCGDLDLDADLIDQIADEQERVELRELYHAKRTELLDSIDVPQ